MEKTTYNKLHTHYIEPSEEVTDGLTQNGTGAHGKEVKKSTKRTLQ